MKNISIIIFDDFTETDLFLMRDILSRNKKDWFVEILGSKDSHISSHGISVKTHHRLSSAAQADVVLFCSGRGTRDVIRDTNFLKAVTLNPKRQLIGSICSGALILAALGLLNNMPATTHPKAKQELETMGVSVLNEPLICHHNIATAGGCFSAIYLTSWVIQVLFGEDKRREILKDFIPVGQEQIFDDLIQTTLIRGMSAVFKNNSQLFCKL